MKGIYLIMGITTLMYLTSCSSHESHKHEEIKFLVTSPIKMDTSVKRDYVCQIQAFQHIELRALERGYLQKLFVDEGQFVKQGQMMFQIMPLIYQAELEKAEAEASFARIEFLNTQKLAESNVVAPNELALAKAKYDKALAELSLAKVHLGFTQVRAPFDGIMDHFHGRLGSLVEEGELLTTLSDNSKMWVYFNVPEAEYLDYKAKVKKDDVINVELLMANNKMFGYPGIVTAIEADFNNETGNIAFRATFPNPKGLLRHGETGNVQMTAHLDGALIIPQKATFEILEKKYVFVVNKENIVKQREITIAAEIPDLYIITSGLSEKEKIVLEGIRKVKDNDKIEFKYEDPKTVISHLKVYVE